ncbi:MAG: hypothetical protein Q7K42_02525 [Candidatus Diapherotrites archaeon]|nr:hypothetical protein [Candidatus Diapherotrites archaeon]
MVKQIQGKYQCEECEFVYKDKDIAQKCENWCKKNDSCNFEIIKYAIK